MIQSLHQQREAGCQTLALLGEGDRIGCLLLLLFSVFKYVLREMVYR